MCVRVASAWLATVLLAFTGALVACDSRSGGPGGAASAGTRPSGGVALADPAARPFGLHLPPRLDRARPAPLVVWLHGYGAPGGEATARAVGLDALADEQGFVLAMPDGTVDSRGARFWNASDACCDFDGRGVDDVAYIAWILRDVAGKVAVDRDRVFVMGQSNGGFLAHRVACELGPRIAGAVSLAGAAWKDASRCKPAAPVSILQIQGDADDIIRPHGGRVFDRPLPEYPSTQATMALWADKDGCAPVPHAAGPTIDFDELVPGAETTELTYGPCRDGASVDLWSVAGGSHIPHVSRAGLLALWAWMTSHARHAAAPPSP